jgi:hypothetical protein
MAKCSAGHRFIGRAGLAIEDLCMPFIKLISTTIFLALLGGCNPDVTPQNSVQETADDWTVLFNGNDLTGWRSYGEASAGSAWVVEDGALVLDVDDSTTEMTGGDLITEGQYENFELELEWKISAGGNSGIFFGVQEIAGQRVAYETGIEMQILDDDNHIDGKAAETRAGSCYALYPPTEDVVRPVGEYNEVRLVVRDANVEHWLNGQKIVEYTIGSEDWSGRVGASKFADWEHFAGYRKGHVALQDHTDRVWFRNIRIREL